MNFLPYLAASACLATTATSLDAEELIATFEGLVAEIIEKGASLPSTMAQGDRVIGCIRFPARDFASEIDPERQGPGLLRHKFEDGPALAVMAISVGDLIFRSGQWLNVINGSNGKSGRDGDQRLVDGFIVGYANEPGQTPPPEHPGAPPGWTGLGAVLFEAPAADPDSEAPGEVPAGFDVFDFAKVDRASGYLNANNIQNAWLVRFDLDLASIVINDRPVLPRGAAPESAEEAARLCRDPTLSALPPEGVRAAALASGGEM